MREALLNLVQNALDAMTGGGTLGIRTAKRRHGVHRGERHRASACPRRCASAPSSPSSRRRGGAARGSGSPRCTASSSGIAARPRSSRRRARARRSGSASRRRPGRGTGRPGAGGRARGAERILIVEDHDDSREFMKALLESDGHTVDAVNTMHDAPRAARTLGSRYDVLITDIGLPDGSGWELVESARAAYPALRIGVVTGWEIRTTCEVERGFHPAQTGCRARTPVARRRRRVISSMPARERGRTAPEVFTIPASLDQCPIPQRHQARSASSSRKTTTTRARCSSICSPRSATPWSRRRQRWTRGDRARDRREARRRAARRAHARRVGHRGRRGDPAQRARRGGRAVQRRPDDHALRARHHRDLGDRLPAEADAAASARLDDPSRRDRARRSCSPRAARRRTRSSSSRTGRPSSARRGS